MSVGPDTFQPPKSVTRPSFGMKNSATTTANFDLWSAGGADFPSPTKQSSRLRRESPIKSLYAFCWVGWVD